MRKKIQTKAESVLPSRLAAGAESPTFVGIAPEMATRPEIISYKTTPKANTSSLGVTSP